ncbi:MAG: baseplate J/gp47 family protein, partial [bacterium]
MRVPTGRIADGEPVLVSYQHGENFSVTYVVDQVPGQVQSAVDARRHVTADVLAKAAVPWSVELTMTVVLAQGAQRSRVDADVQSAVAALFDARRLGDPLRQSDVIAAVESVPGVSYVIVPLTRMAVAENSTIL